MLQTLRRTNLLIVLMLLLVACGGAAPAEPEVIEDVTEEQQESVAVTRQVEEQTVEETTTETEQVVVEEPAAEEAPQAEVGVADEAAAEPAPAPTQVPQQQSEVERPLATNPFVSTADDPLSTFALDVDTGSYTVMRNYLLNYGTPPPPDTVRVEEFVNYFPQNYPLPTESAFAIYMDGAPSPFQPDGTHILRVGIQGYDVPPAERPATALTFVIDGSGSMAQQNRLELVKESLALLVDRMRPQDTMAIVIYDDTARVVLPPTSGSARETVKQTIRGIFTGGSTNAEAGLRLGYDLANESFIPGGINRVVLLSDGVANVGMTGPDGLAEMVRGYADAGITLTTVGVGLGDYNDALMEQLADQADGFYAYVDTLREAERLFVEDLSGSLQTIAIDAKVQVEFNPQVVARYRLLGYENRAIADEDFRDNTVDAGEIGAGHSVTALYAVQFMPDATGPAATARLRWEQPETREVIESSQQIERGAMAGSFDTTDPHYQLDVVVAQFAELLRGSQYTEGTTFDTLRVRAERLASQIDDPDVVEFVELVRMAAEMGR